MANHGLIIESKIAAKDIDALNRSVVCASADVDGGSLLALTAPSVKGEDRWTVAQPSANALTGLWVAYNPTNRLIEVEGREFAGLSVDDRLYTNLKGKTFDAFKPKVGDEIEFSEDCIDPEALEDLESGDFLESVAGSFKLARQTAAQGATAGHTAFLVEFATEHPLGAKGIGDASFKTFRAVCVAE